MRVNGIRFNNPLSQRNGVLVANLNSFAVQFTLIANRTTHAGIGLLLATHYSVGRATDTDFNSTPC